MGACVVGVCGSGLFQCVCVCVRACVCVSLWLVCGSGLTQCVCVCVWLLVAQVYLCLCIWLVVGLDYPSVSVSGYSVCLGYPCVCVGMLPSVL